MAEATGPRDAAAGGILPGDAAPGQVSLSVLEALPQGVVVLDAGWVYRYTRPAPPRSAPRSTPVSGGTTACSTPRPRGTPFQQANAG